jgi:hypothetical protein
MVGLREGVAMAPFARFKRLDPSRAQNEDGPTNARVERKVNGRRVILLRLVSSAFRIEINGHCSSFTIERFMTVNAAVEFKRRALTLKL